MSVIRWILGGFAGAAAGILIWVLCGYFTHYEVGWIAWGVGFMVGFGVRYTAYYFDDGDPSLAKGIVASLLAVIAIMTAKGLLFTFLYGRDDGAELRNFAASIQIDDEANIAVIASELSEEAQKQGKKIAWPPGVSLDTASRKKDFPLDIWQKAEARWNQLGPKEQQERKHNRAMLAMTLSQLGERPDPSKAYSFYDILWFGLAIITAFKVGVGTYGND